MQLRYLQATGKEIIEPDLALEIKLSVSEDKQTFTLVDTGIGMTEAELVENLGTIAHSGSGKFLANLAQSGGVCSVV
jgi:molecular chaperone HtpG